MVVQQTKLPHFDDHFDSYKDAVEFFRHRDRVRSCDLKEGVGARTLSWSCDGSTLGVGCENKFIFVGTLEEHRLRNSYVTLGHEDGVTDLEFSNRDRNVFATCSMDQTIRIFDIRDPKNSQTTSTKNHGSEYLAWTPDDSNVVCVSRTNGASAIVMWDPRTKNTIYSPEFKEQIYEIAFHPSGRFVFLTMDGGRVAICEWPSLNRFKTIQAHPSLAECLSIAISPDGSTMAIGGSDACVSIWDLDDLSCTHMIARPDYSVRSVSFSQCSNMLAWGSEDRAIEITWLNGDEKIMDIPITSDCFDVAWNPRSYILAYATVASRDPVSVRLFGCPSESRRS